MCWLFLNIVLKILPASVSTLMTASCKILQVIVWYLGLSKFVASTLVVRKRKHFLKGYTEVNCQLCDALFIRMIVIEWPVGGDSGAH